MCGNLTLDVVTIDRQWDACDLGDSAGLGGGGGEKGGIGDWLRWGTEGAGAEYENGIFSRESAS